MIIQVKVKTNQPKFLVIKTGKKWLISTRSPPENNKANLEIIKQLSKQYYKVRIIKGAKTRNKTLLIEK